MKKLFQFGTLVLALTQFGCSAPLYVVPSQSALGDGQCLENPDKINCKLVEQFAVLNSDSFERSDIFDTTSSQSQLFGWHKIIDDMGRIVAGAASNFVDVTIFSDQQLGAAADGNHAVYFYGRQGYSVHNIYLISKVYDIQSFMRGSGVLIRFDYLPIDLETSEYLKLEVCNDTAEACGVSGSNLSVAGLNSNKWKSVFTMLPSASDQGRNGRNHSNSDWQTAEVSLYLEDYQKREFIFRFNARMDEGFVGNNLNNGLEDGIAIDNVRATAYDFTIPDDTLVSDPHPDDTQPRDDFEGELPSNY